MSAPLPTAPPTGLAPASAAVPPDGRLRRRDLLLSLKYSTIEACFSVPMLNLTMPNLPFAIAFVVVALGWNPWAVGLMAALPHWCNFLQPPLTRKLAACYAPADELLHDLEYIPFTIPAMAPRTKSSAGSSASFFAARLPSRPPGRGRKFAPELGSTGLPALQRPPGNSCCRRENPP
jgi:hypothetical protein